MARRKTQRNPRDPNTRERILEAADLLFGELGFDATATRLIAERCDVNKALIHYHFANKQQLFDAVLDRYYERLGEALRPLLTDELPLRARLLTLIDGYVDFLTQHQSFSRMVQREIAGGRHHERIRAHMVPLFQAGSGALAASYPAMGAGPLSAPHLLISFYGMIVSYFTYSPIVEGLLLEDPLSPVRLEERKAHLRCMAELAIAAVEAEQRGDTDHRHTTTDSLHGGGVDD